MESGAPQRAGTRGSTSERSTSTPGTCTSATANCRSAGPTRSTFSPVVFPGGSATVTGRPGVATWTGLVPASVCTRMRSAASGASALPFLVSSARTTTTLGTVLGVVNSIPTQGGTPPVGPDCQAVSSRPSKAAKGSVPGRTAPGVSANARDEDATSRRAPRICAWVSQRAVPSV
jgi:hypothetical protein